MRTKAIPIVEGGILTAIAIIFALISAYVPILGSFVNFIWPVPIILLGVRHGYRWSIMATVVAGLLIAIMMHPLQALSVVVGFGLIGIVIGHGLKNDYGPVKTLVFGSIASLLSKVMVIFLGTLIMGFNPIDLQNDVMYKSVDQVVNIYRSIGYKEDEITKIAEMLRQTLDVAKIILPAGFALASILDTYINFTVAKMVLKKMGHYIPPFPQLKDWSFPGYMLPIYILSWLFMLVGNHFENIVWLKNAGMNLNMFFATLLLIQGLALFYFFADRYNLSKVVKIIILFMVFSNGFLTQLLIIAGIFDLAMDYRKLRV